MSSLRIGGALPFNTGASSMLQGGAAGLPGAYANAYTSAVGFNNANYDQILRGYQDTLAGTTAANDAIGSGYTDLYNNVLSSINGVGDTAKADIRDRFARESSNQAQGLINRGLGNTTVANSVQRGVALDEGRAQGALGEQLAQLRAGYQSQLGQAGLNQRQRATDQQAGIAGDQLRWLNTINAPYPDARMYSQLAQQYGQAAGGDAARQAGEDLLARQRGHVLHRHPRRSRQTRPPRQHRLGRHQARHHPPEDRGRALHDGAR